MLYQQLFSTRRGHSSEPKEKVCPQRELTSRQEEMVSSATKQNASDVNVVIMLKEK